MGVIVAQRYQQLQGVVDAADAAEREAAEQGGAGA